VDVIKNFNMPHIENIGRATPSKLCIAHIEQQRDVNMEKIAQISTCDNEAINEFITTLVECLKMISILFSKFNKKSIRIIKKFMNVN
jgi:hypothetical protein